MVNLGSGLLMSFILKIYILSGKYFERRKRNNLAAKKSRDQRKVNKRFHSFLSFNSCIYFKVRESQVCQRATLLEKENAVLRAQVFYLLVINTRHKKQTFAILDLMSEPKMFD